MREQTLSGPGQFGDARLTERHEWLAKRISKAPDKSFPALAASDSDLEAVYRFLGNDHVRHERLLEPHYQLTSERIGRFKTVFAIHDTTEFRFGGRTPREGLGRLSKGNKKNGFYGHFALAVSGDGQRQALGLLGFRPFFLLTPPRYRTQRAAQGDPNRKSARWAALVEETEQRAVGRTELVHVMDREGDDYQLFEKLLARRRRFIIRLGKDRYVLHDDQRLRLRQRLNSIEYSLTREVPLSSRVVHGPAKNHRVYPARRTRVATLHFRALSVRFPRPEGRASDCAMRELTLNAVQVYEPNPPEGEQPVEWLLVTTERIDTKEDLAAVIDGYRTRWVIEEYFKALKTGCAYESRQLESSHALLNALGLLAPVAVALLRMRSLAREFPQTPGVQVLTPVQFEVLRAVSKRHPISNSSNAQDILLAIAGLGGHIKNNGDPGWLVLHRGYQQLTFLEAGWNAALAAMRCDQS